MNLHRQIKLNMNKYISIEINPKKSTIPSGKLYKNINKTVKTEYYINDDCKNVLHDITYDKRFPYLYSNKLFDNWHLEINNW